MFESRSTTTKSRMLWLISRHSAPDCEGHGAQRITGPAVLCETPKPWPDFSTNHRRHVVHAGRVEPRRGGDGTERSHRLLPIFGEWSPGAVITVGECGLHALIILDAL